MKTHPETETAPMDVDGNQSDSEATRESLSTESTVVQESRASEGSTLRRDSKESAVENWAMMCRYIRDLAGGDSNTLTVLLCAGRPGPWSMVRGLTLSESSNIAILGLPIFMAGLNNQDRDDLVDEQKTDNLAHEQQQRSDVGSALRRESSPVQPKETAGERETGIIGHREGSSQARLMGVPIEESVQYAYYEVPDKTSTGLSMRVPALLYHCYHRLEAEGTLCAPIS